VFAGAPAPTTLTKHNWHVDFIAAMLEASRRGEMNRLIINLAPRQSQIAIGVGYLPAWLLGHDPSAKIICASYGQDLADKHPRLPLDLK